MRPALVVSEVMSAPRMRAVSVPSPLSGWWMRWQRSEPPLMFAPVACTTNFRPSRPLVPTSGSALTSADAHGAASGCERKNASAYAVCVLSLRKAKMVAPVADEPVVKFTVARVQALDATVLVTWLAPWFFTPKDRPSLPFVVQPVSRYAVLGESPVTACSRPALAPLAGIFHAKSPP